RRHRDPVLDYQCGGCGRVFNAFTASPLGGTRRPPSQLLLIFRGVAQAAPTARMARELACDRKHLLGLRHRLQEHARLGLDRNPLGDAVVEADESYVNAGEKIYAGKALLKLSAASATPRATRSPWRMNCGPTDCPNTARRRDLHPDAGDPLPRL